MSRSHPTIHQIELQVTELAELFNSMDPTPFHHRALDRDAEEFLENWAVEFPRQSHFKIVVHVKKMPARDPTPLLAEAIRNYFDDKAVQARRSVRLLMVEGRMSMVIGLVFLALCLLGADLLSGVTRYSFGRLFEQSLLIGGWVAMWRPMQIFLYEWWPVWRKRTIYRNLGRASVVVIAAKS